MKMEIVVTKKMIETGLPVSTGSQFEADVQDASVLRDVEITSMEKPSSSSSPQLYMDETSGHLSVNITWETIPTELLIIIFRHLGPAHINKVRCVCRRWKALAYDWSIFGRTFHTTVVLVGPYASGKTTLLGRLMYEIALHRERTINRRTAESSAFASTSLASAGLVHPDFTDQIVPGLSKKTVVKASPKVEVPVNPQPQTMFARFFRSGYKDIDELKKAEQKKPCSQTIASGADDSTFVLSNNAKMGSDNFSETLAKGAIPKAWREAVSNAPKPYRFSCLLDRDVHETAHRKTINYHKVAIKLPHNDATWQFVDTPGTLKYSKNRLRGINMADFGVMVLSLADGERLSECGKIATSHNIYQQVVDLWMEMKTADISKVVVFFSKADRVPDNEQVWRRFVAEKECVLSILSKVQFRPDQVQFTLGSAMENVNVLNSAPNRNVPPSLSAMICRHLTDPVRYISRPLRIAVDGLVKKTGIGAVWLGYVLQGHVKVGDRILVSPLGKHARVKSLHLALNQLPVAIAYQGDCIGMALTHPEKPGGGKASSSWLSENFNCRNGLISSVHDIVVDDKCLEEWHKHHKVYAVRHGYMSTRGTLFSCERFTADVFMVNRNNHRYVIGSEMILHVHNAQIPVTIHDFVSGNKDWGEQIWASDPNSVPPGHNSHSLPRRKVVRIEFSAKKPLMMDLNVHKMHRILLRESHTVLAVGKVTSIGWRSDVKLLETNRESKTEEEDVKIPQTQSTHAKAYYYPNQYVASTSTNIRTGRNCKIS